MKCTEVLQESPARCSPQPRGIIRLGGDFIQGAGPSLPVPAVTMPGFSRFAEPALLCPLGALLCTCTRAVDRSASARLRHLPRRLPPAPHASPASLQPRGPAQRWPWRQGPSGACRVSENRGGWSESPTRLRCVAGVLLELGLEKEHVTKQRAERYVLKLDAEAQARFKSFLQNSSRNPHTLFVLIHDHAHWDLARLVWLRHTAGLARTFFGITDVGESWDGGHSLKPSAAGGAASSADATAVLQTLGAGSDPRGPPGAASESYRSRN